ncbi:MAG: hypothetical protein B6D71_08835 [gamma proteobacterium symbiont of Stewartia floridana]|nr:MAG: hypothetical protein B6D71_08835 [gamma proteobacterium symbiont of Stewartia floridana]
MESVKKRLDRTFLKPQGSISRYLSAVFIFLVGAGSIYIYFAIEYFLCANDRCIDLVITKAWIDMSAFFVIYGICCFVIGIFVFREKQLQIMYAWSCDILIGSGFYLFSKSFFAIAIEIGNNT